MGTHILAAYVLGVLNVLGVLKADFLSGGGGTPYHGWELSRKYLDPLFRK